MKLDSPQVQAGIRKYGSAEAYSKAMRKLQAKSRENYLGTGGFAGMDKDRVREIARKGVATREANRKAKAERSSQAEQESASQD